MPAVVFRNISKYYENSEGNQTAVLKDINLTVSDGEFVCILGPSGCGKSTLLEIAAGLLPYTEGEILLDGKLLSGTSRDVGVVFQDSSLFPWRNIRKNVEFGLEVANADKSERALMAQKAIEMVGLKGFEDKYPHQLSGGMRQRAGIARTLVNNPACILMDEPFSAVDHLTRLTLQDEVIRIWGQQKKTIIFITHDVSEAVYLSNRVVLLTPGPGRINKIFDIPLEWPRKRNDPRIMEIIEKIYYSINNPDSKDNVEYTI